VWKTPTGKQIQSRLAAGVSRSANMYVGVYGNCLYACDSCSGMILRWKPCTADIPLGMISTRRGATVSHPRMVVDVCAEAGWSPRRRSSWAKRRGGIEPSSAQAMGTSTASMRPAVSSGNKSLAPAVSGVSGGIGSSPNNFGDGIAYVGAVGVSRGDRCTGAVVCVLRPLQCTEGRPRHVRRGFAEARDRCLERHPLRCGRGMGASTR
jgi:hypothetical protein